MNKLFGQRSGDSFGAADSPSRSPIKNIGYGSPSAYPDEMLDDLDGSPYGTTMKLPVKNHIGRLEVNYLFPNGMSINPCCILDINS
jgi:hypothetical protein